MKLKKALITGIYGQDGSYLCEQLTQRGYEVHGICHDVLSDNSSIIRAELACNEIKPIEHHVSLYDYDQMCSLISTIEPDEIYHMAAIHRSAENKANNDKSSEKSLFESNICATHNILSACYEVSPNTRVLTAGSCLMFDNSGKKYQSEDTPFDSLSLYGIAKITEAQLIKYYRLNGLFACMAILYNHESHRRSAGFVTRKIADGFRNIADGTSSEFVLGNLEDVKDWGFAGDYTKAMQMMLSNQIPIDYILATGELHTIGEYAEKCASMLGISDWQKHIKINESLVSRKINGTLCGDSSKIEKELGWKREYSFDDIVSDMVKGGETNVQRNKEM